MASKYTLVDNATLKRGFLYIIPLSGSGTVEAKLCIYLDDNGGLSPGTRAYVSSPSVISASGYTEFTFSDEPLAPGNYWICAVSGDVVGPGWDMGSGLPGANYAVIMNGDFPYTLPPPFCPAPAANYANSLATYVEYEYDGP